MKVSVIIPNFNGARLLQENLPSVHQAVAHFAEKNKEKTEIIVTDDGSTDESEKVVSGLSFACRFLHHEQNTGFAGNVNRGVREATGEFVVLLNSDVRPEKDFLEPLLKAFVDQKVFAVGCTDKSIEAGKAILRGRGVARWYRGLLIHKAGSLEGKYTLWASGGSSAYRRAVWEALGGMDEIFDPFYWEDIDLSYRAWKSGYTVRFSRESVVVHEHEKGVIRTHEKPQKIRNTAYRNQFLFVWKNADRQTLAGHWFWLPYHCAAALTRGDSAFFRGLSAAVVRFPAVIAERRHVTGMWSRSDSDVVREANA